MQDGFTSLGRVVKKARNRAKLTQEKFGEKVGVGYRHIMGIENEGKYPGFELLYRMIRELNIDANEIFYPEKKNETSEADFLIRHLYQCNKRDIVAITAFVESLLSVDEGE